MASERIVDPRFEKLLSRVGNSVVGTNALLQDAKTQVVGMNGVIDDLDQMIGTLAFPATNWQPSVGRSRKVS